MMISVLGSWGAIWATHSTPPMSGRLISMRITSGASAGNRAMAVAPFEKTPTQ